MASLEPFKTVDSTAEPEEVEGTHGHHVHWLKLVYLLRGGRGPTPLRRATPRTGRCTSRLPQWTCR